MSISSSLQPDTWGRLSQLPWVDQCFPLRKKPGRGIPLLALPPVSPCQLLRPSRISQISNFPNQQQKHDGGMADDVLGGFLCRWELQCGGLDAALVAPWAFQGKIWNSGDEKPKFGSHLQLPALWLPILWVTWSQQHQEQGTTWLGMEE